MTLLRITIDCEGDVQETVAKADELRGRLEDLGMAVLSLRIEAPVQ